MFSNIVNQNIMEAKIVFITGASSGIGEGCARKFAKEGWNLILNARTVSKLEELKAELEVTHGVRVYILPFDVRDRKLAAASLESLPEEWKAIDVLVNNAGLVIGVDKEFEGNLDEWDIMIDTNIRGLLAMTRLVVPGMVERGRGHIINIGSIAGDAAYPGGSVYCATKAAVKALSDGLRIDLVDTPLRVTNIKPGMVETNFIGSLHKDRVIRLGPGAERLVGVAVADKNIGVLVEVQHQIFVGFADSGQVAAGDGNRVAVHYADDTVDGVPHLMNDPLK